MRWADHDQKEEEMTYGPKGEALVEEDRSVNNKSKRRCLYLPTYLHLPLKEFLSGGCMVAMDNHHNDQGVASDLSTRGLSRSKPLESIPPPLSSVRLFPYRR
ncbi:hypothetical protein SAY87_011254 [Trapa incisa]|uniref:Uncharacterized protein n=1 Tax=Trapa incisa TaxID=236973 RepID=A0AAN7GY36_9MYRT|nr:hypothetical protein SAY87_011254 [Trapa incisa]